MSYLGTGEAREKMPHRKYMFRLTEEECNIGDATINKLRGSGQMARRAAILLKVDLDGPGWTERPFADAYRCRTRTLDHAQHPTVSIDKQAVRLVKETRESLPATGNHSQRVHCECELAGTAAVLMFCEPPSGWRQARARERRTNADWAHEMAGLLEGRCAGRRKVKLVFGASPRPSTRRSSCDGTPARWPVGASLRAGRAPSRKARGGRELLSQCAIAREL